MEDDYFKSLNMYNQIYPFGKLGNEMSEEDLQLENINFSASNLFPIEVLQDNKKQAQEIYNFVSSNHTAPNAINFIPRLNNDSDIFTPNYLQELYRYLPFYNRYLDIRLLYSTSRDGTSLKTLYNKCENIKNTIIVIKDDEGNVFGAYCSEAFHNRGNKFYGTGETFLYSFFKENRITVYETTGINEYYIYSDSEMMCFGCSGGYFSLCIKDDFLRGYSKMTDTYKNSCLSSKESFFILNFEVWTFQND